MPRYGRVKKRKIGKDAVYNSELIQRFINKMMVGGKKSKAENIFYSAFEEIKAKLKLEPLEVFEKAIAHAAPMLEVKPRRVGGATYQVPIEITRERGQSLAMQWIREAARARKGKSMTESLTSEIIDAYNQVGLAMKNRETMHKTADANRAFAHFRW
ncbi:MAG: 30S ribosomal protein S7 [Candidatus Margulisiibacteriota bacterium]